MKRTKPRKPSRLPAPIPPPRPGSAPAPQPAAEAPWQQEARHRERALLWTDDKPFSIWKS